MFKALLGICESSAVDKEHISTQVFMWGVDGRNLTLCGSFRDSPVFSGLISVSEREAAGARCDRLAQRGAYISLVQLQQEGGPGVQGSGEPFA